MKAIGIILLLTLFLIGAYEFGLQQTNGSLVRKADSLQRCLRKGKTKDSIADLQMDKLKKQLMLCRKQIIKNPTIKTRR
jgi:hypothetical protein